jgi:hypothetical protein
VFAAIATDRFGVWTVAGALLVSGMGALGFACCDWLDGRFTPGEVLLPTFATACLWASGRAFLVTQ